MADGPLSSGQTTPSPILSAILSALHQFSLRNIHVSTAPDQYHSGAGPTAVGAFRRARGQRPAELWLCLDALSRSQQAHSDRQDDTSTLRLLSNSTPRHRDTATAGHRGPSASRHVSHTARPSPTAPPTHRTVVGRSSAVYPRSIPDRVPTAIGDMRQS
ncbi:hypothetical protein M433DRAFT_6257 [Acidomyces richmondensis BFW]|nr:hypothetical protein M433DRAFT_6257 [Acidomyces richmondensis BFW]